MGENAGIEQGGNVQPQGQQQQQNQQQQNVGTGQQQQTPQQQGKPYDNYLAELPESFRPVVAPIFDKWDADTTRKFQEIQQSVSAYDPYKDVFDQYEPEAVQHAVGLAETLSTREGAEQVFQQLAQVLGYEIDGEGQVNSGQQNGSVPGYDPDDGAQQQDIFADPRFRQLQDGLGNIAQTLQQQQESQRLAEIEKEVQTELAGLVEKNKELVTNPDGTENAEALNLIYSIAASNGGDLQAAFKTYGAAVGKTATQQNSVGQNAPIVGGGAANGMPSQVTDPAKWTTQQRKEAALAVLRANNQQR